ncbi:MAG: OsmC family protein [Trueperaceae bacterium]|nr:OsmC family protein [Trueperaceae bacterium]
MPETTLATLHHLVDKRFVGTIPDGRQVLIDGTKEHPLGMGPMQLVLNAWGGCVAYDVVEMLKKRRVDVKSYRVELEGDRHDGVPAFFTRLRQRHVIDAPGLDRKTFERFVDLAMRKYCSVGMSLKAEQSFEVELLHEAAEAAEAG